MSVAWICRKIWGAGITQVQPSNCFRRLEKLVLLSIFDTSLSSLMMWNLQSYTITVLNERMWHFRGSNILWPFLHIFRGDTPLFAIPNAPERCGSLHQQRRMCSVTTRARHRYVIWMLTTRTDDWTTTDVWRHLHTTVVVVVVVVVVVAVVVVAAGCAPRSAVYSAALSACSVFDCSPDTVCCVRSAAATSVVKYLNT